ncbi:MAG: four helix bundle protein [Opitutaceae bacterium]|jgi:four helix bundle protein|nr:four helix bundle protein [Opitutaceae bacterium]
MKSEKLETGGSRSEGPQEIGERAFAFAVRVVKLCQALDERPGVSRTLSNQLLRSGTSIGANLEESKGGQSRADFLSKNSIALKEARETHYWLRLLTATGTIPEHQLESLLDEACQITAILTTIVKKLKSP